MTDRKHTPGPWRVDPNFDQDVQDAFGNEIATAFDSSNVGEEKFFPGKSVASTEEAAANARLIAAAPDMYEALKALLGGDEKMQVAIGGNPTYVAAFLAKARAALSKAVLEDKE